MTLQGLLVSHNHRLARDQELLLDGQRRLSEVQAQIGAGMNSQSPEHLVSVVSDRQQISELSGSLANTTRKDWMTLENLNTEMPLTEDCAQPPPAFGGQVRCRSIYDAGAICNPVARRIIQECVVAGEQACLLQQVPMKMKLADVTTAMLALTPSGTAEALVIRAPVILAALREYFKMLWDRATPVTPHRPTVPEGRLTREQQTVLELTAEGLHDDAVARRAGMRHH